MKHKLIIPGLLPGLNEYTEAQRANRYKGAEMKKQVEHIIGFMIKSQLRKLQITKPVHIHYLWIEKNKMRDKSNISFAKKFIEDALVKMKVLKNDGWKEIEGFTDRFAVDQKKPRVEIIIEEVTE